MNQNPIVVFVCEHGAAKSILAAAHFNRIASELGLDLRAVARGTNPDDELSSQTVQGLSKDGLVPTSAIPEKLTEADLQNSRHLIAFCDLPTEYQGDVIIQRWDDIPPVSENYERARDAIVERIRQMLDR
jgi:protein-tyrosine-phosphatase